jgi:hypothetical protein
MKHTTWPDQTPLPIPEPLTEKITQILDGRDRAGDSYTRLANPNHVQRCSFCNQLILPCVLANEREYDATVYFDTERNREMRVDLELPHLCDAARRYREFLKSESEFQENEPELEF